MHILIALVIGIVGTASAIRYTVMVARSTPTGRRCAVASLGAVAEGTPVEVHGHVDGRTLASPISGTPCVWWRVLVTDNVPHTTRTKGIHLDRTSDSPLTLDDGTGVVSIDPTGSTGSGRIAAEHQEAGDLGRAITIEGQRHTTPGRNQWRIHREHVIESGTAVWAVGQVVDGPRLVGSPEHPVAVTTTPPAAREGQRRRNLVLGALAILACPAIALLVLTVGGS